MSFIDGLIPDFNKKEFFPGRISFENGNIIQIKEIKACEKKYILPGLVDAHVHIESSMLLPSEFGRKAVQFGTIAALADPHEAANVLGLVGVEEMILDSTNAPIKIFFGAPSCVPATPFETSGSTLSSKDIFDLFKSKKCHFLSEVMNVPGVLSKDPELLKKITYAKDFGYPIDGHAPGLSGEQLKMYVQSGITTDHECTSLAEAIEKIGLGMKVLIRNGSAAKNLESLLPLVNEYTDKLMFCTDDCHPDDLLQGHIDQFIKYGLSRGFSIFDLLRVASINPVLHYKIPVGILREGDPADFIIVEDLERFEVKETRINGIKVHPRDGQSLKSTPKGRRNIFHKNPITAEDIVVINSTDRIRVIDALDGSLLTRQLEWNVPGEKFLKIQSNIKDDILKMVVLNRYKAAQPAVAFVHGFGLKEGAFASTVAHDSHNILAVGVKDEDLIRAIQLIQEREGGLSIASGQIEKIFELPFAGLMSEKSAEETASTYKFLSETVKRWGCQLHAPFMTLSFMALLVIPDLKLSDQGLFDGNKFSFVPIQIPD